MWKGASLRMLLQNGLIAAQRGLVIMGRAEGMDISPWGCRLTENLETVRSLHLCEYHGARLFGRVDLTLKGGRVNGKR